MQSFLKGCKEDPLLRRTLIAEEHGKRIKGFHCCKDSQCSSQSPQEVLEAVVPRYLSCSKVWPLGDRIDPGNQEMALLISGKKKAASPSSSTCTCRCAEYNNLSIFGAFERREESCLIIYIVCWPYEWSKSACFSRQASPWMSSAMREARLLLIDAHIKITPSVRTAIAIHQSRRQQRRRAPLTGLRRVTTAEENSSTSNSSEGECCEVDWSVKCLSHSCSSHVAAHGATVVLLPSNVAASPRAILLEVFLVVDRLLEQACVPFLFFSFVLSCFLSGCEIVHHQLGILSCGDCARVASCCRRALSIPVLLYGCPGPPFESLRVCSLLVASIVCFLWRLLFFRVCVSMIVWNLSGGLVSEVWGA